MRKPNQPVSRLWQGAAPYLALCVLLALILAACGRSEPTPEPSPTPAPTAVPATPTAATSVDTPNAAQSESPLAQPDSPLEQPDSPVTAGPAVPLSVEDALALAAQTEAAEPDAGNGSIAGVLYSYGAVHSALADIAIYLEPADEVEGKFYPPAVSGGPQGNPTLTNTTASGQIQIQAPPGNYYLSVWSIYNWLLATETQDVEAPRLITIKEGDQLNLGVLYVDWP